jgi:hypothetical protein
MWVSGANVLNTVISTTCPWKSTGLLTAYPSMRTEVMVLWTSLTLTSWTPRSWDIWRTASRRALRCTAWSAVARSAWVIRAWGCGLGMVMVVLKPRTCSPAMPITAWPGMVSHMSSASVSARSQLSMTAWRSATAPACMCVCAWRTLPTPSTIPLSFSRLTISALTNSVPISRTV